MDKNQLEFLYSLCQFVQALNRERFVVMNLKKLRLILKNS